MMRASAPTCNAGTDNTESTPAAARTDMMLDALYRRRLERDLETWREKGWVTLEGATAILGTLSHDGRARTATVIGFLGAVLIALAAVAFVAANWEAFPRPMRLAVLVCGMAACYAVAALLARMHHTHFADAAVFAGAALFGASIVLVAQSYHLSGDYPDALLLWAAGAFLAAVLGASRASLLLALVVIGLWSWYEVTDFGWIVHWPFLGALAAVAGLASVWRWRAGLHLCVLALIGWIGMSVVALAMHHDWTVAAAVVLLFSAGVLFLGAGHLLAARGAPVGGAVAGYGLTAMLGLMILMQIVMFSFQEPVDGGDLAALAAAFAVAVLGAALLLLAARAGGAVTLADAAAVLVVAAGAVGIVYLSGTGRFLDLELVVQLALGVLTLAAALWAIGFGNRVASRTAANLGLTAFAIEILYLYFVTFGTLLDTALFFLVGGVLLIGLAAALVRLQRRLSPARQEATP